jgi:hypothetical protein
MNADNRAAKPGIAVAAVAKRDRRHCPLELITHDA